MLTLLLQDIGLESGIISWDYCAIFVTMRASWDHLTRDSISHIPYIYMLLFLHLHLHWFYANKPGQGTASNSSTILTNLIDQSCFMAVSGEDDDAEGPAPPGRFDNSFLAFTRWFFRLPLTPCSFYTMRDQIVTRDDMGLP